MATGTSEKHFEQHIEQYLIAEPIVSYGGTTLQLKEYHSVDSSEYNPQRAIIPSELIAFLRDTQAEKYDKMVIDAGGTENANRSILDRLNTELKYGTLALIRKKTFDAGYGAKFEISFRKPENNLTPEAEVLYNKNRLAIVRQLYYSNKNKNSIDTVIFLNGLPIVTLELKNTLTGQKHHNAIKQYMTDRKTDGEPLLEFKRCLVHFAVGTEQVFMTTKLAGHNTKFFPFNKSFENTKTISPSGGYKTDYLWEDVLRRDSLINLVHNYINIEEKEEKVFNKNTKVLETKKSTALIFPRFHQRRAVERLITDVKLNGTGKRYLIQHSAGSGKSHTITWLGYRLASIHQYYSDEKVMFDSVLVVTDRRVLDKQLQKNFKQFEQEPGEVEIIDDKCTSLDLKSAIENRKRIIVTTLQKFSVISDTISLFPDRKYAVIIDEAHSSQSGDSARNMRKALSLDEAKIFDEAVEKEEDVDAIVAQEIEKKGLKKNISFFAFTATPKPKTIELFSERINGRKEPFDEYTMEDAIKEGFILDVMLNYTSFKRYYKLIKKADIPDKEYEKKKTVRLLSSFVDLQDAAIERKARVMIDHFVAQTSKEIEGEARAMLVTRSRLHAVRYKRKFDEILQEMRLPYGALVAFSGTVKDGDTGEDYTEASMNNLQGKTSIPDALKLPKYRFLIVANKYQTGFDEPLLHTMFVDKQLGGVASVQTLSRLNRTRKGKRDTMIIDFVNDPEDIQSDFQKFYGKNYMEEENETNPNSLYDVKGKIQSLKVFTDNDINDFAKIFFTQNNEKEKLNGIIDKVCSHIIAELYDEEIETFKGDCKSYVNLYRFLSQIITFTDVELEKWYVFITALIKKLPYVVNKLPYDVLSSVELDSYKLQYQYNTSLNLESGDSSEDGMSPASTHIGGEDEIVMLTNIIKVLNDTFGLDLTDEDKVDLYKMKDKLYANEELMSFFNSDNTRDNIQDKFNQQVEDELLEFINGKLELYNKLTDDKTNTMFKRLWFNEVYNRMVRGVRL